jgi:large subunit ribosomal protein L25
MLQIKAKTRNIFGRKANSLKKKGTMPAVLYGPEIGNFPLQISIKEFEKVFKEAGESSLIVVEIDDKKYEAVIHDLVKDPLKEEISHVDFYCPSSNKKIIASVPLIFEGEEAIQKNSGGNLIKEFQHLEIKCLPKNLIKEIVVDLTALQNIGDKIQIKDLKISEGIEFLKKPEETVVVFVPRKEEIKEEKIVEEKPAIKESKEEETIEKQNPTKK